MSDLVLTIYEEDDTTPYFAVGTAAAHANPYLQFPDAFAEAEVDLKAGSARIGRLNVRVIDKQTGATQAERFLTALLGNPAGYSEVNGRRALLAHDDGTVVLDGICAGATLTDTFAGFSLALDDIRARGVNFPLFTRSTTSMVLPRGVLGGYGLMPKGNWLVPPVEPLLATYEENLVTDQSLFSLNDWDTYQQTEDLPAHLILTPAMRELGIARGSFLSPWLSFPNIEIGWREVGEVDWNWISDVRLSRTGILKANLFILGTKPTVFVKPDGTNLDVDAVRDVWGGQPSDGATRPVDGQTVEMVIRYAGAPSDQYPLHFEGTAGELLKDVLDGVYSTEPDGTPIDLKIRYDADKFVGATALPELQVPVRLRITEPEEDLREWFEKACKALGIAPALDSLGRLSPVGQRLPDESVVLPEINDTNSVAIPGWEHPITGAVTQVDITYPRDYRVAPEEDPFGEQSAGDSIASVDQPITVRPQDTDPASVIQQVMGVHSLEIDGFLFRALGNSLGLPVSGDVTDETGAQIAYARAHEVIDRFAFGGQRSFVRCRRSDADIESIRVGDWVLDARSWAPDYASGERGRNHLCQVVSIRDIDPAWREMSLLDAAPYANPVDQPELGTVTSDADGVVSVPIDEVPAGGEARVDYAISDTVPDTGSPLWTFLGRTAVVETLESPPLPAGSVVWIRARGEQIGRRPSAWTTPVDVTLANTPRILSVSVTIDAAGVPTVSWEANDATEGVRIYASVHNSLASEPAVLTQLEDADADDLTEILEGVTVAPGQYITVEVEPWTGFATGAVSGSAGERVRVTAAVPPDESSYKVTDVEYRGTVNGIRLYIVRMGARVSEARIYWKHFPAALPEDWFAQLVTLANLWEALDTSGDEFTVREPEWDEILKGIAIPVDADGNVIGDGFEFDAKGTEPPIVVDDPTFTEAADGTETTFSVTIEDARGVVSGVDVFLTQPGEAETGPFAATLVAGAWSYDIALHPDHPVIIRARVNRNDGGDPLWLGPYSADTDKVPGIPTAREQDRTGDQVTVYVDGVDTDTASLWYREVVAGTPGAEVEIDPRSVDPRFGEFLITADPDLSRDFRIYGKNSAAVVGPYLDFAVPQYVEFAELDDVTEAVDELEDYVDNAFHDGVVSEAEAKAIAEHIRQLNVEKADVDQEYTTLAANPDLTGSADTNLDSAKTAYDSAHADLISAINAAIADGLISAGERTTVSGEFDDYEAALATYRQRMAEALDAIKNKGVATAYQPRVQLAATRSGTTVTITLTVTDPLLKATAFEFAKREGGGADTGFVTSWDSSTGTAGTHASLTRVEDVAVTDGSDSEFRWRLTFTDEAGVSKTIGDTVPVSNLQETTKTLFVSFVDFRPLTDYGDFQINLDGGLSSNMGPSANGTHFYIGSIVLPVGVVLRRTGLHAFRNSTSEELTYGVHRIAFNTSPASLFVTVLSGAGATGWMVLESGPLSETVAADTHYLLRGTLTEPSARNTATVRGVEIEYDVDAYVKTY